MNFKGFDDFDRQLIDFQKVKIHAQIKAPLLNLIDDAHKHGFKLAVASGYRSFEAQLKIFNDKFLSKRIVLDDNDNQIDLKSLSDLDKVLAILRFSMLPGLSRHHFGTDLDVYAVNLVKTNLKLTLNEYEKLEQSSFNEYLKENLAKFDFYRPYNFDRGGVSPEPWHISYYPVFKNINFEGYKEYVYNLLVQTNICAKDIILNNFCDLFDRFVEI